MDKLTSKQLREDFILPLAQLVSALTTEAAAIDAAITAGTLPTEYIPLNAKMAKRGLALLDKFKSDIESRRKAIATGVYRYREDMLAKMRDKYREEKKKK